MNGVELFKANIFSGGRNEHISELSKNLDWQIKEIKEADYLSKIEQKDRIEQLRQEFVKEVNDIKLNLY